MSETPDLVFVVDDDAHLRDKRPRGAEKYSRNSFLMLSYSAGQSTLMQLCR